jgi:replicative DNA helicase
VSAPAGERTRLDREPPNDLAAEQCVLGGMMLSKDSIADVMEILRAADFYRPAHQALYGVILDLYGRGEPTDVVSLASELGRRGLLAKAGGAPYLHTLIAAVPQARQAAHYARIVREQAVRWRLEEHGVRSMQLAREPGDADELVDLAGADLMSVAALRAGDDYAPMSEIVPGALDEVEAIGARNGKITGVPTGFADLDALTNGLHPGQMVIVAARPAIGKSTLAADIARVAAVHRQMATVIFSLEMGRNEIAMRMFSAEARVPLHAMRTGQLTDEQWAKMSRRMQAITDAPLFIDDSPNMSMMQIRAKCRRLRQQHDLRLVIIDYIQLMSSPGRAESRQAEVSGISRSIKLLAKELGVPVVALSQLNRGPEQRSDKRPILSDLRESGSIEQDADLVILLHREDAYERDSPRAGEADFIVAKHRNGPTSTVTVAFQGHYARFVDMASGDLPGAPPARRGLRAVPDATA